MPKIAKELTALEVGRLKVPGLVFVGKVPGLALQINPAGARSWVLRVKVGVKRREMGLGAYPAITLAQAHEKARSARELIERGTDPILARERAQSLLRSEQAKAITFKSAALAFIKAKTPQWSNAKHAAQWQATLETYAFPIIGELHVQDVQDAHILKILEPIWTSKTETATRVRGRIENILDWASARKYRTGLNPARWRGHLDQLLPSPKKTTPVRHFKAVPLNDTQAFFAALKTLDGVAATALAFTMLTATRSNETRGAKWSEINMGAALWVIPANRMKARREHRVPLSDAALEILRHSPPAEGNGYVFQATSGKELSNMTMTQIMRRMKIDAVPHGLRSTFMDWAAEKTNFSLDLVKMSLSHAVKNKVEAAYRRGDMLEKRRELMNEWALFVLGTETAQK